MDEINEEFFRELDDAKKHQDRIEIGVDTTATYSERIIQKEGMEKELWRRIGIVVPWVIEDVTRDEDLVGIDAKYSRLKDGTSVTPTTVQLKFCQTGNDILMETILDWKGVKSLEEVKWTGRDVRWEVDQYFCIDTKFNLRIASASYLKSLAKQMTLEFVSEYLKNNKIRSYKSSYGDVRIKTEESDKASYRVSKVDKILVFIEPHKIEVKYTQPV